MDSTHRERAYGYVWTGDRGLGCLVVAAGRSELESARAPALRKAPNASDVLVEDGGADGAEYHGTGEAR